MEGQDTGIFGVCLLPITHFGVCLGQLEPTVLYCAPSNHLQGGRWPALNMLHPLSAHFNFAHLANKS
jgi:hypothetical protein